MAVLQYKDPVTGQLKDLPLINQGVKEAPIDGKQYARKDGEWSEIEVDSNVDLSDYTTKEELNNKLLGKVDKQEGKQLTTEDFTTVLKEKLDSLSNYNDTEIRNAIDSLESAFNTLVEGNATAAIDTFNEIVAFLKNVENSQDLDSIIAGINTTISNVESKIPDTNNFLSKDGGIMNNTNLVGNLNADMLDGLHSNEFLIKGPRVYSKEDFYTKYRFASMYSTDYMSPVDGVYNYGQVLSFVDNCSTTQFYCPDNTGLIYFRNSWGTDSKGSENFANIPWYEIITSKNVGSQTVAAANKLSTTSYLWGQSFDGSGDVNGVMNFINQGNLITVGGEHWANNTVLSTGYDTTNGDWTKLGVAGTASNSASLILNYSGRVGIGVDYPTHKLHINGSIKAEYNPDYDLAHTIIGEALFYNDSYSDPATSIKAAIKVNGVIAQSSGNVLLCTTSGNVGIGTTNPIVPLHVMGKPIFRTNAHFGNAGAMHIQNDYAINGWDRAINICYPNMGNGSNVHIHICASDSKKNGGYIAYHYAGYNSDNNCMKIGLYAVDDILNVTANRRVGINTTTPQESLDVNGNIKLSGNIHFKAGEQLDHYGNLKFAETSGNWGIFNSSGSKLFTVLHSNGHVGIDVAEPEYKLDVNGNVGVRGPMYVKGSIFMPSNAYLFMASENTGIYLSEYGIHWHNSDNTWHSSIMTCDGSVTTIHKPLHVDGEVIFENSRFITTSGFTDGDYAYSHAIYGGYYGIDVCEFYEENFKFKGNGGGTTILDLTADYAIFNGAVHSSYPSFVGRWNDRERFRLIRDAGFNTWLQAATDTTNEGGKLFMSGMHGTHLSEFNVLATTSNFKGSIIAEGDVTAYSDIRLKNRIESVNNVLDTIDTLDVFRYTWKDREDKSIHIGVSAQQVQAVYPEFVLTSSPEDGTDYLTVNYAALATCIAIQGIKELAKKGDERDKRIAALEEEVISLKEQLRYGNK